MQTHNKPIYEYTDAELVEAHNDPESSIEKMGATSEIVLRFYDRNVRNQENQ